MLNRMSGMARREGWNMQSRKRGGKSKTHFFKGREGIRTRHSLYSELVESCALDSATSGAIHVDWKAWSTISITTLFCCACWLALMPWEVLRYRSIAA